MRAQTLAFAVPNGRDDNGGLQNFGSSLGLLFTVNPSFSLTISSLGYWDDALDGVAGGATVHVAIFDRSGTPAIVAGPGGNVEIDFTGTAGTLAGNIVFPELNSGDAAGSAGSGRSGQFRLANLTAPVTLSPGTYAVVVWGFDANNEFLNGVNFGPTVSANTFGGAMTFDGVAFDNTSPSHPGSYPTTSDGTAAIYAAATFSAIPEPAATVLGVSTAALLAALIAPRRRTP